MKAVTLGNSGVLIREIDPPKPQPHQIMVKVKAWRSMRWRTGGELYL